MRRFEQSQYRRRRDRIRRRVRECLMAASDGPGDAELDPTLLAIMARAGDRQRIAARLREAGMALEAVQAQAGHRSIESTRIYLHLSNGWLVEEYRRAMDVLDALPVAEPRR